MFCQCLLHPNSSGPSLNDATRLNKHKSKSRSKNKKRKAKVNKSKVNKSKRSNTTNKQTYLQSMFVTSQFERPLVERCCTIEQPTRLNKHNTHTHTHTHTPRQKWKFKIPENSPPGCWCKFHDFNWLLWTLMKFDWLMTTSWLSLPILLPSVPKRFSYKRSCRWGPVARSCLLVS